MKKLLIALATVLACSTTYAFADTPAKTATVPAKEQATAPAPEKATEAKNATEAKPAKVVNMHKKHHHARSHKKPA